jgi:hypothetical protein
MEVRDFLPLIYGTIQTLNELLPLLPKPIQTQPEDAQPETEK